jgi:hypothetical protein
MCPVRWEPNPLYRPKPRWELRGRSLWLWRGAVVAVLAWVLIAGSYLWVGVLVASWVVAEISLLRRKRGGSRSRESATELGEDRQVGVERDPIKPTNPEGK